MSEQDVFDLDAAYAEEERAPFPFRWAGSTWELPHLGDMDWRAVSLADEMDVDAIRDLFAMAFGDERAEEWERVKQPTPAMIKLFNQWLSHSGMAPGEAPSSDDSSTSTAEPSKPTSTASTKSGSAKPSSGRRRTGTARVNS